MGDNKISGEDGKYGSPHEFDPDFSGPVKSRSCTDVLCCLLLLGFLVGWGVVAAFGFYHGDPTRLLYPTDSAGRVCGRDSDVLDKKYLFFFDLTRCASPKVVATGCPTSQVCVEKCPSMNWFYNPAVGEASQQRDKMFCQHGINATTNSKSVKDLVTEGLCAYYYVKSDKVGRRCVPSELSHHTIDIIKSLDATYVNKSQTDKYSAILSSMKYIIRFASWQEVAEGVFEDIKATWHLIIGFCVLSMVVSLIWIFLLRYISKVLIWFSLVAFVGICGFGCYYTMDKYLNLRARAQNTTQQAEATARMSFTELEFKNQFSKYSELESTWLVMFCVILTLLVVCLLLLIVLRKRVNIAVALIGQASKAVGDMMSTLVLPIVPYLLQIIILTLFCVIAVFLASTGRPRYTIACDEGKCCTGMESGDICDKETFNTSSACPDATCMFNTYYVDPNIPRLQIYNVFALFWCLFFTSALGEMVLAGAFSSWYWSFDKSKDLPALPVINSLGRTLRYHVGTLAFGSLIIAIVRMIRLVFEYIDQKVREKTDSKIVRCLMCCCRCCLWCLEKFLKFVNRNAYVYCAIYGTNFCSSAKNSFSLLMRNIARVVVLDKVTDFLLFIGKMVVTGSVGILSFYAFTGEIPGLRDQLPHTNYYLTPVILITIVTYFISSAFFSVYEIGVDTLFFCFLEDSERNDGSEQKPYFMSKDLMKILQKENKFKEE